jgi:hypothetical protein
MQRVYLDIAPAEKLNIIRIRIEISHGIANCDLRLAEYKGGSLDGIAARKIE